MLELRPAQPAIVVCMSSRPGALDALASTLAEVCIPCRVAPDELLLVGGRERSAELLERSAGRLADDDPAALVLDQTDGWAGWTLAGAELDDAFSRISALRLPEERPAFLQGAVAGVPAKVIAADSEIRLFVPSPVAEHVATRILTACRDLGVGEGSAP